MIFYQPLTIIASIGGPGWSSDTTYQVMAAYWLPNWYD